jgi:hypothetical protein
MGGARIGDGFVWVGVVGVCASAIVMRIAWVVPGSSLQGG